MLFREMSPAKPLVNQPDPSHVPDTLFNKLPLPARSRVEPCWQLQPPLWPVSRNGDESFMHVMGTLRQPRVHNEIEAGDRNDVPLQAAVLLTCLPQVPSSLCPRDGQTRLLEALQWPLSIALPLEQQATVAAVDPVYVCKAMHQAAHAHQMEIRQGPILEQNAKNPLILLSPLLPRLSSDVATRMGSLLPQQHLGRPAQA
jgi:hypothetical protein